MIDFKEEHVQAVFQGLKDTPKIPELDENHSLEFLIGTEEEVLYPLVEAYDVIVTPGAFFGDEGKGKTVAAIAQHPKVKLIARTNSGENAGHTVWHNGVRYVFHLAPSGLLTGKPNAIGPNCVMDPISFMEEIQQLIDNDMSYDNLIIGNVHIVTPYHKLIDALGIKNSSTLKGMSPVHSSKVTKKGLRLDDIFNHDATSQADTIKRDSEIYRALLSYREIDEGQVLEQCQEMNERKKGRIPKHVIKFLEANDKIDYLINLYDDKVAQNQKFPQRGDVTRLIQKTLEAGDKVLLEPAQAAYLSNQVENFWGSSTSADTTSAGTKASAGYNQERFKSVTINVHKVPTSRVGIGGNPSGYVKQDYFSSRDIESLKDIEGCCDDFDVIQRQFFDSIQENGIIQPTVYKDENGEYTIGAAMAIASSKEHDEKGATTEKPRVTGIFDCVAHHKVNSMQGPRLTISAVDRLDGYDKVGIVIAYVVHQPGLDSVNSQGIDYTNGSIIKPGEPLPCENVLKHCYPIIKVMDGWKGNPIAKGKRKEGDPLPEQCQRFLGEIEHYTGANIISIGNGANTEDLLYLKKI